VRFHALLTEDSTKLELAQVEDGAYHL
jgi:hypothetical protein